MSAAVTLPTTPGGWHRRVWRLAGPIILSNMSVPLVGAVDTAVVGHLPDPVYIGAVALGAVLFSFLFWGFGFLRMGTTGFVAQAYGAGDDAEVATVMARALLLAGGLGSLIVVLQAPVGGLAFWALGGGAELQGLAYDYYAVRVWSAPATLANYALLGCLIGLQNTPAALVLQLLLNGVNAALDLLFVFGFGWGVRGVALASLIGEYSAMAFGLWVVARALRPAGGHWRYNPILHRRRLQALLRVNVDIFVRTLCLQLGFFYFAAQGTRLGETTLAANAVLLHLLHFMAYGSDGFAHAAEALVGGAYGARDLRAFRAAVKTCSLWALLVAALFSLVYAAFGDAIIGMITGIADVRALAHEYLPWLILLPLVSIWSFQLDGIFIGTTHSAEMRNGMLISLAVFAAAASLCVPLWHNHGLWLALTVFMAVRALTLGAWYPRIERRLRAGDQR